MLVGDPSTWPDVARWMDGCDNIVTSTQRWYLISASILGPPTYWLHIFRWMMGAYSTDAAPLFSNYLLQEQVLGAILGAWGARVAGFIYF